MRNDLSAMDTELSLDLRLGVIATHPVHYFVPLYVELGASLTGFQVAFLESALDWNRGQFDPEFNRDIKWDAPLLDGYDWVDAKLASTGMAFSALRQSLKLRRFLKSWVKEFTPDVVLVPGWAPIYVACAIYLDWLGIPIVIRPEARVPVGHSRLRSLPRSLVANRATAAAVIGSAARDELRRLGMADVKLFDSPYATPLQTKSVLGTSSRERLRAQFECAHDEVVFLYVGKFSPYKGVDRLLRAFTAVVAREPKVKLILVGDGPEASALRGLGEILGIGRNLIWTGFINQPDLQEFYLAADVFVLFSEETWGLVVNEAMAHGLPCVVSVLAGASRDLVAHGLTGFRVNPAHRVDSSYYLIEMLDPQLRASMSLNASSMIEQQTIERASRGIIRAASYSKGLR